MTEKEGYNIQTKKGFEVNKRGKNLKKMVRNIIISVVIAIITIVAQAQTVCIG